MDEDVALDQAVKFCQIQMATSAQRQVGCTDSLCLTPGNNTSCFSLWNANPIFSPLLTPLETQRTHWMFSHLAVVLPPLLPPPPPTHTHTHALSFLSLLWDALIMHILLVSLLPSHCSNDSNVCWAAQREKPRLCLVRIVTAYSPHTHAKY